MDKKKIFGYGLSGILRKFYAEVRIPFPSSSLQALIDLCEWQDRIPIGKARVLHISQELQEKILTPFELICLSEFKKAVVRGWDLKPYLGNTTRSIRNRNSNKNDFFFSDWGLLHFHLGMDFQAKGERVSRSRRVLIAKIDESDAYLVDIVPHGQGFAAVWGDDSYLKILYNNFPHIFTVKFAKRENLEASYTLTPSEYMRLRDARINVPFIVDDKIMLPPSSGLAADGSSYAAVRRALSIYKELEVAEQSCKETYPSHPVKLAIKPNGLLGFYLSDVKLFCELPQGVNLRKSSAFFERLMRDIPAGRSKK